KQQFFPLMSDDRIRVDQKVLLLADEITECFNLNEFPSRSDITTEILSLCEAIGLVHKMPQLKRLLNISAPFGKYQYFGAKALGRIVQSLIREVTMKFFSNEYPVKYILPLTELDACIKSINSNSTGLYSYADPDLL